MANSSGMEGTQKAPLSELATRYRHRTGKKHKLIAHSGKSGLTPVYVPPHLKSSLSTNQKNYIRALDRYQQRICSNFTIQQLVDLEAFAPYYDSWSLDGRQDGGIDYDRLNTIPMHPLYARSKWDQKRPNHMGRIPLGKGRPGYFEAQNPLVWQTMEPCLRLASGILSNSSNLVWWDALFNGDFEFINKDIPQEWMGRKLLRFKPSSGPPRTEQELQQDILDISDKINLRLHSGTLDEHSGMEAEETTLGLTFLDHVGDLHLGISFEMLECMMRGDLTASEMKLEIFRFAVTLLHETAHAFWLILEERYGPEVERDPYFDGQPLSEVGYSMEEIVFGGIAHTISEGMERPTMGHGREIPCGTIFSIPYLCNKDHYNNSDQSDTINVPPFPPNWDFYDVFPIPVGYFEDILQPEFLDHARQYGTEATKMGPKTIGSRIRFPTNRNAYTWSPDFETPDCDYIALTNMMSYEEETAAKAENLRRSRAQRILDAIGGRQDEMGGVDIGIDPMDIDDPEPVPETDPNHYTVQGKDFETISAISTEFESEEQLPECPRYEEFRHYFLANRGQGLLCLDSMYFEIPVYTLYHYIQVFGGLDINADEWIAFLDNCDDRAELFYYDGPLSRSAVGWFDAARRTIVPTSPTLPAPLDLDKLREACLNTLILTNAGLWDFDFIFLLKVLKLQDPLGGGWLSETVLRELVDWHDLYGDLWCWGPNGIVRRRSTWP